MEVSSQPSQIMVLPESVLLVSVPGAIAQGPTGVLVGHSCVTKSAPAVGGCV